MKGFLLFWFHRKITILKVIKIWGSSSRTKNLKYARVMHPHELFFKTQLSLYNKYNSPSHGEFLIVK